MPQTPSPAPTRRTGWRRRFALLGLGLLSGLLLAEVAARAFAWVRERSVVADWERLAAPGTVPERIELPDGQSSLGNMVRRSGDPAIVYEFLPHLRARFRGQECRFNAEGFRGDEWPAQERAPGELRIAGLGDSVMFGWGVAEDDAFLQVLRRELQQALPRRAVQVLNTGVPGYNTAMEVATFERKVAPWRPDIVLLDWVGNDTDLPNLIARQASVWTLDRSFLWELARKALGQHSGWIDRPLQEAPWSGERFESRPEFVPEEYRYMVGEDGVRRALEHLAALAQAQRFHLAVTCHFEVPDFMRALCQELGLPLVENGPAMRRWMVANGVDPAKYTESPLVLGNGDPHPSALSHRLFGATIAAFLQQSGWL